MTNKFQKMCLLALAFTVIFSSCKKDDPEENDEEVITTVTARFIPVGGGSPIEFSYDDPDGPGGNAPTIQNIQLVANKTYNVSFSFSDKTKNPPVDLTSEITTESDAHRIYYAPSSGSNITISNLNNDGNGIPLGVTSTWTTTSAASGTIKITLRHYGGTPPNKAAADPVDSNKSSTDVEVTFNTTVL
jgi:hypothetical protein